MEDKRLQAQCPPHQRDVWESLPVSGVLHPQHGVGLALWVLGWVLGLAALAAWQGPSSGGWWLWVGWGHAAPPVPLCLSPHSLSLFLPYIQRFIFYTRCHLQLGRS